MSALGTLGLDAARAVDPARYPIAGAAPRAALRPATREEVAEALKAATREGLAVAPWGGGAGLAREDALPRYDLALDLTALDRIVEYDPEDLTLTAECGVTIATLRATLGARGQELPLEAPHAARATLGGVLAANASGSRRLRLGSPRDRILGARFALADGTLARTGGKVVKNVAGYGIHRMLCGSRGALAVILEASLKLLPAPGKRVALMFGASAKEIADPARWTRFPRLEPAVLTVLGRASAARLAGGAPRAEFAVIVGLEDDARWVEQQEATVTAALAAPARRIEDGEAEALWQALCDLEDGAGPQVTLATADNTPAALAPLLDQPEAAGLSFHARHGRLLLDASPERAAALVPKLAAAGFALVAARGSRVEPALPPQSGLLALRQRIRDALDPTRRLAFGARWVAGSI